MSSRPERPLALVTGASRGIGLAIARKLAPAHRLILVGRSEASLQSAATEVGDAEVFAADLSDAGATAALGETLAARDDAVSVLVNNAGVAPSAPLHKTDDAAWSTTMAVNLQAPFMLARALLPGMAKRGWGRVVNIVSTAGLKGYSYTAAYSASKGGLLALTRALAAEFARKGVTVNAVCPGFTETALVDDAIANIQATTGRDEATARRSLERFSPQGRLIRPVEVAAMVEYLVGEEAGGVTGVALPLDGGETSA